MIYGLYLSAQGVMTASHKQDVTANNIANAETVGFKKDLALFQQRRTELREAGLAPSRSNALLEKLGGGVRVNPTIVDHTQGEMEHTGSNLDVAIVGDGFLRVSDGRQTLLTRDGRMAVNHRGRLALANNENFEVLDPRGKPIELPSTLPAQIGRDGTVNQGKAAVGRVGLVSVPDPRQLTKIGGTMLTYPTDIRSLKLAPESTSIRAEYVERANVEPSTELAQLMDAQRQLEANANMIRYQDQMLSKLAEVGKIG